jgi:hypothetical protein
VLPKQLLNSLSNTEKLTIAEKVLEKSGMKPSLLRKATAVIPTTAAKEGLTEGAQEFITAAAEKFVDENQDLFSSENFNRYLESAVRGAVAGGGFGGVQAGFERLGERGQEARARAEEERRAEEQRLLEEARARGEGQQLPLFEPGELARMPSTIGGIEPPTQKAFTDTRSQIAESEGRIAAAQKLIDGATLSPDEYRLTFDVEAGVRTPQQVIAEEQEKLKRLDAKLASLEGVEEPKLARTKYGAKLTPLERAAGVGQFEQRRVSACSLPPKRT